MSAKSHLLSRQTRRREMQRTFADVCVAARRERGSFALAGAVFMELFDLIRATVKPPRISSAPISEPPRSRGSFTNEIRQAWRGLIARPRRSSVALSVGLLTISLAVSTTIFTVVDALVIRTAPFPHGETLVEVQAARLVPEKNTSVLMPRELVSRWAEQAQVFTAVGGFVQGGTAILGGESDLKKTHAMAYVTPGLMRLLGVAPVAGRLFVDGEGRAGQDRVALIGEEVWRARFAGDPAAIGRELTINNAPYTVVGVMPADFRYPYERQRVWLPLDADKPAIEAANVQMIARVRPELSAAEAEARVQAAGFGLMKLTSRGTRYPTASIRYLSNTRMDPRTTRSIWLLFGATSLLLLTACANVSSLTMSQVFARSRDFAIQSALGASRPQLIRQALIEQVLVGAVSLLLAIPLTLAGLDAASTLLPRSMTFVSLNIIDFDLRALAVLAVAAISVPLLSGIVPAIAGSRASVVELLKQEGRASSPTRASRIFRQGLVVTEVASAVVLLVTGALLIRSFIELQAVDRGFDAKSLVFARVSFPSPSFPSPLSRRLYMDRALAELPSVPGVIGVTQTSGMPPDGGQISWGKLQFGHLAQPTTETVTIPSYFVRPGFFGVTGIRIVAGRDFTDDDTPQAAIISESMAAKFWPGGQAVGGRYRFDDETEWHDVIGVASEVRSYSLDDSEGPIETYYKLNRPAAPSAAAVPTREALSGSGSLVIRMSGDARPSTGALRDTLLRIDPKVMLGNVDRVEDMYQETLSRQRLLVALMAAFSIAGLTLAAIGVYGVMSGLVTQRLREISVRLMLGAEPAAMARSVIRGGLILASLGAAIGITIAVMIGRLVSTVLFDVEPTDIISYAVVVGVLVVAALAASWRPAMRAMRADPVALLRDS
jgi:predicted permease